MPGLFEREPGKAYKERMLTDDEAKKLEKPLTARELGQEMASLNPPVIKKEKEEPKEIKKTGIANR